MSFMGLDLRIDEDVFAPQGDAIGDAFHQAVAGEIRPADRVLDMGTGSGVSGILAARAGATVVAVDVNPKAVACARANAARNGVADRMTCLEGDVFGPVEGDFDLIVFDPPFRWFAPRDLLDVGTADEDYQTLTRFMAEAKARLRPGGRIVLNFGTSGDMDYLRELADREGYRWYARLYGQATQDGLTAQYYVIRLTA
jgi:release factor glutamine methyltransferase